jgi:hypothetical protein
MTDTAKLMTMWLLGCMTLFYHKTQGDLYHQHVIYVGYCVVLTIKVNNLNSFRNKYEKPQTKGSTKNNLLVMFKYRVHKFQERAKELVQIKSI